MKINLFKRKTKKADKLRLDLINYQPIDKQLNPIKKCLLVSDEDYTDMSFEDDLQSFNFSGLSDEARKQIIDLIKADNEKRAAGKLAASNITEEKSNRRLLLDDKNNI